MKHSLLFLLVVFIFTGCTTAPTPSTQKSCINSEKLNLYGFNHLERVAKSLREEKQNNKSFEITMFMLSKSVTEYSDMLKSSAQISNVARFMPIPYAGEVCNTTKLISNTALNLGHAANTFNQYKQSSNTFLDEFDKLNRKTATSSDVSKLAVYGDTKLLADARDLEISLQEISSSTATMASAMQSISDALDTTNGYVNGMKSYVGINNKGNADDKGKVVKNRSSMLSSLTQMNQKISLLEKSGQVYRYNIAKARVYSELAIELAK